VVPFALEAELSGVGDRSAHPILWYRREVELAPELLAERLFLHVGACDFETRLFVNGRSVGQHRGGYAPISCEISHAAQPGTNTFVLRVEDRTTWSQPRGKQITGERPAIVDYDRVTGIWQTVWLEPLPHRFVEDLWSQYHVATRRLQVHVAFDALFDGDVTATLRDAERSVVEGSAPGLGRPECHLSLEVPEPRLWSPDTPHLYELEVRLGRDGATVDRVRSPLGLREVSCGDGRLLLNGEPIALRGILDQGYFPGGWYTAPRDEDLRRDVELVRAMGLNTVRKHQKAEDPRYLHWADRLGLLVWTEMPSGRDFTGRLVADTTQEWMELVRRDRGHACVMAWVPFNESWGVWQLAERPEQRGFVEGLVGLTRTLDPSRPVLGNDGWEFAAGDVWGVHSYATRGPELVERVRALRADPHGPVLAEGDSILGVKRGALPGADPSGLPMVLSECGGIGFVAGSAAPEQAFAYGELPDGPEDLEARIRELAAAIRSCPELAGFVWTQFTDVQQEINGLLDFERRPKLPLERLREIFTGS